MKKALLLISFLILLTGCTSTQSTPISECVNLCLQAKAEGMDLSNGPCLSNDYYPDYVCDVAHDPRIDIDNLVENQCPAYYISAFHFVEVDEDCNYIYSD